MHLEALRSLIESPTWHQLSAQEIAVLVEATAAATQSGYARVDNLHNRVSPRTRRRTLQQLAEKGLIKRVHGGLVLNIRPPETTKRPNLTAEEKYVRTKEERERPHPLLTYFYQLAEQFISCARRARIKEENAYVERLVSIYGEERTKELMEYTARNLWGPIYSVRVINRYVAAWQRERRKAQRRTTPNPKPQQSLLSKLPEIDAKQAKIDPSLNLEKQTAHIALYPNERAIIGQLWPLSKKGTRWTIGIPETLPIDVPTWDMHTIITAEEAIEQLQNVRWGEAGIEPEFVKITQRRNPTQRHDRQTSGVLRSPA